ncbi:MAG TPA: serine/threonine-protein kinase [Xanthobacteraceae bacterium]|jgi:serine/threonine protein kinase
MNVFPDFSRSRSQLDAGSVLRRILQARLNGDLSDDEFVGAVRGHYSQGEFVDAIATQLRSESQSLPTVMALVYRLKNRGDIPVEVVRLIESKISRRGTDCANDDLTVDLCASADAEGVLDRDSALLRVEVGCVLRDRYEIEQLLGTGGRGTVFKALDRYRSGLPAAERYVAIKLLHEHSGNRDETFGALRHELQFAQMLSHPNIVKVYDVDRDGDVDFFTMELLEGELLSDLMRRFLPLPMCRAHAWSIIGQIASGLEHAHARKIVHADLKPQNIMITNSGEVRILDFGSSHALVKAAEVEPWHGSSSATPAYACCELLDGRVPDPRDDLYALACIAYELLTGAHPFQRRRASEARDFGVVPVRPSGLSRRQWRALAKGLSWHRAGRSISVADWSKELKPGSEAVEPLRSIGDLKPVQPRAHRPPPVRPSAVFSVLLSIAAISLLFVRLAPGGKVSGEALPASASSDKTLRAARIGEAPSPSASSSLSTRATSTMQSIANHGTAFLPGEYHVKPGQHFAEIRVHRPAHARRDAPLIWWTEPASAKPGVDYVSQGKVSQLLPKGQDSMSVFVKLLPKADRSQSEVFYIAVTDKADQRGGKIIHTAVRLPANKSDS